MEKEMKEDDGKCGGYYNRMRCWNCIILYSL